ncbi:MAG: O-antigen ligase family protein [Proteobacteria bacterium]|nr:O-antigen ligase family protein [Pseudomonadota bacterium]
MSKEQCLKDPALLLKKGVSGWELARSIFIIALALSPLLFGSVYPWAYGLMEIAVLLSFGLLFWQNPRLAFLGKHFEGWGVVCLAGLIFMAGLQLIPLPGPLVKFLAGPIYNLWKLDFLPPNLPHPRSLIPLTLYPYATASVGILFLCYLLAFTLARTMAFRENNLNFRPGAILYVIVAAAVAVALVGIFQKGLNAKAIYGFFSPLHRSGFMGPYVNYNHFAGCLELALPLGVGLLGFALISSARHGRSQGVGWLLGGAIIVMLATLFMCGSRGGILSFATVTIAQLLVLLGLLSARRIKGATWVYLVLVVIIMGVAVHITDWSNTLPRFQIIMRQDPQQNIRLKLFKDVAAMGNQLPLTGSGLGTFAVAYPSFKTLDRQGLFNHAHNDYLEFFAEMGWPGLLMFLGFSGWVLWRGSRVIFMALTLRTRGDPALIQRALLISGSMGGWFPCCCMALPTSTCVYPPMPLPGSSCAGSPWGSAIWANPAFENKPRARIERN